MKGRGEEERRRGGEDERGNGERWGGEREREQESVGNMIRRNGCRVKSWWPFWRMYRRYEEERRGGERKPRGRKGYSSHCCLGPNRTRRQRRMKTSKPKER